MTYKHGKSSKRVHALWLGMIARCENKNNASYKNYGERGIAVCDEWHEFMPFYNDMGDPPNGLTLERINNDLGYFKANCRWASRKDQAINRRSQRLLTLDGETYPLSVWSEKVGISYVVLHARISKGWSAEEALGTPLITQRAGVGRGQKLRHFKMDENETFATSWRLGKDLDWGSRRGFSNPTLAKRWCASFRRKLEAPRRNECEFLIYKGDRLTMTSRLTEKQIVWSEAVSPDPADTGKKGK